MDVWRNSVQLLLLFVLCSKLAESKLIESHSPTFPELQHFPLKDGYINIAEEIANDYNSFGMFILDDKRGSKVAAIAKTEHGNSVAITVEILRRWLQGKGRMPVTWLTLIKCLQDIELNVLADDIKGALSQEDESKAPDSAGSSVHKTPDNAGPSVHKTPNNAGPSVHKTPGPSVHKAPDNAGTSEQPKSFEYSWITIAGTGVGGVIVVIAVWKLMIQKKCGGLRKHTQKRRQKHVEDHHNRKSKREKLSINPEIQTDVPEAVSPSSSEDAETPVAEVDKLDQDNHTEITGYLLGLNKTDIYHLGLVLGLSEPRVRGMGDSKTFLDDMVVAWLQKVDQVQKRGAPSWRRLVEALRDRTVGQNGIARKIIQDRIFE